MSGTLGHVEELLSAISLEYNQAAQEISTLNLRSQKDYEIRLTQQLNEMQQMRNTVYELELFHHNLKDSYEAEIKRLKLEISQRDHQLEALNKYPQQTPEMVSRSGGPVISSGSVAPGNSNISSTGGPSSSANTLTALPAISKLTQPRLQTAGQNTNPPILSETKPIR